MDVCSLYLGPLKSNCLRSSFVMIPKSHVMISPWGAYLNGDEAQSQDGGLLTLSPTGGLLGHTIRLLIITLKRFNLAPPNLVTFSFLY